MIVATNTGKTKKEDFHKSASLLLADGPSCGGVSSSGGGVPSPCGGVPSSGGGVPLSGGGVPSCGGGVPPSVRPMVVYVGLFGDGVTCRGLWWLCPIVRPSVVFHPSSDRP